MYISVEYECLYNIKVYIYRTTRVIYKGPSFMSSCFENDFGTTQLYD